MIYEYFRATGAHESVQGLSTLFVLSLLPSPRTMPRCDSGLPHDTRNITCTWENVFERLPAREGQNSTLFNNSKNLTTSSQELRPDKTETAKKQRVKWYESRRTRRYLYHTSKVEVDCSTILVELILTVFWLIIRYFQCRNCIWANFLIVKFQSWKVNFETEVCSTSADLHLTMLWIKEVEIAKSIDDLLTSQSTTGRRDFSNYDMLDEMSVCIEKTS